MLDGKGRIGLEGLNGGLTNREVLVCVDGDDELGRLLAEEQFAELVGEGQPDDQNLFFADVDALVGTVFRRELLLFEGSFELDEDVAEGVMDGQLNGEVMTEFVMRPESVFSL